MSLDVFQIFQTTNTFIIFTIEMMGKPNITFTNIDLNRNKKKKKGGNEI